MGNPAQILPSMWVLKSVTGRESIYLEGGGLCVDPNGIVITVTHGIRPDYSIFKDSVIIATNTSIGIIRNALFVENAECQKFGLCLLRLQKSSNEVFDFCPFLDNIKVKLGAELGARVYSFMMDHGVSLTPKTASVTYPFRGNVTVPMDENHAFSCSSSLEMRTVGSIDLAQRLIVSHRSDSLDDVEEGVLSSLTKLNPSLPLIEVYGFLPTTLDGQCGCPVFDKANDKLIGLFAFSTADHQFLMPTQILREVFVRNMNILGLS